MSTEEQTNEEEEETPQPEPPRYPLAFDANGNPIEVPPQAVAWRVRRGGGRRGRPRHVFNTETGRQLEVPLAATVETLIEAGCEGDRFLLYPIDAQGMLIPGIVAVTEVPAVDDDDDSDSGGMVVSNERNALLTVVVNQLATIKEQSSTLCRALEATTSGYGRVRPPEAPPPVMMEAPPQQEQPQEANGGFLANLKPEQITEMAGVAKMVFEMLRGAMGGGAAAGGGG